MRVHKLTFAALAVAATLSMTACENDEAVPDSGASSPGSNAPATGGGSGSGDGSGGTEQGGGKGTATGGGSGESDGNSGSSGGGGESTAAGKCRTDELEITALDGTVGGDTEGTVAVTFKNGGGRDCTLAAYAGVDLKTDAGPLSAKRTGEQADPMVLKDGKSVTFGITYPMNDSGGSGVRVTGLVVTPPNETKSVTLDWPGAATLPVTDGSGTPVKVGPMGSAGQGE